ncbi:MAG: methylamine utilization protein [Oleiphilaceae bacterium]|nr:methylamine utilization protein [Oleiphilaceae bacterium]
MNSVTLKRLSRLFIGLIVSTILIGAAHGDTLRLLVTDQASGEPLPGAIVTLAVSQPVAPILATVSQKDRAFRPQVLIIPRGSTVDFPNNDNTHHHVYSFSKARTFNIELYADEPGAPVLFDKPGIVEIGCNIHDHMQAYIVVVDTTHVGQSNSQGELQIALPDPPDGEGEALEVNVWHPEMSNNIDFQTRAITAPPTGRQTLTLDIAAKKTPGSGSFGDLQKRFRDL